MPTKVDWQSWARQMALAASISLATSGVIAVLAKSPLPFIAYYSIAIGVIIYLWEYPIPGFDWCGPVKTNFYIRAIGYILLAGPSVLQAPTICPAIFLIFSAIWYIKAGLVGEVWTHPNARGGGEDGGGGGGGGRGGRGGRGGDKKDDFKSVIAAPAAAMYTPPPMSGQPPKQSSYDPYGQPAGGAYLPPAPATPPMPQNAPKRTSPVQSGYQGYDQQSNYANGGSGRSTPPMTRGPPGYQNNYPSQPPPPQPYGGGRAPYGGPQQDYMAPPPRAPQQNYNAPPQRGYGDQQGYGAGAPPPRPLTRPPPPNRPAPPY